MSKKMEDPKTSLLVTVLSIVIGGVLIAALCVLLITILGIGNSPTMLAFAIFIVASILFGLVIGVFKIYKLTATHHERMAILEAGQMIDLVEPESPNRFLVTGTILFAIGLAIFFALYVFKSAILLFAFIPGFIGLAFLFIHGIKELKKIIPPEKMNELKKKKSKNKID